MNCAFCHKEINTSRIHIRDECPACRHDLHICLNCEFHDPQAYRQCRESIREPVQDKEKANYCDFFRVLQQGKAMTGEKDEAFSKLASLFKT
jgi:hypothetical protein